MAILGIEFAPLSVPLKRRLETLAITFSLFSQAGGGITGTLLAIFIIVYTRFWWLCILYLTWIWVYDRETCEKEGRPSEWMRNWKIWTYAKNYFPIELVKLSTVELDPKRNYLFCIFPHGVLSTGASLGLCTNAAGLREKFPNHYVQCCTLGMQLHSPFYRDWSLNIGCRSASAQSLNYLLSKEEGGHVAALVVGGAEESFHCKPGQYKLVLRNRKGFAKIALLNGSPLVPVISFGETDIYSQMEGSKMRKFQKWFKKITGVAPVLILGRGFFQYSFGYLPQRRPINIVVSNPIEVKKTAKPTQEEIDDLHKKFVDQLIEVFEREKKLYIKDYENVHIEII